MHFMNRKNSKLNCFWYQKNLLPNFSAKYRAITKLPASSWSSKYNTGTCPKGVSTGKRSWNYGKTFKTLTCFQFSPVIRRAAIIFKIYICILENITYKLSFSFDVKIQQLVVSRHVELQHAVQWATPLSFFIITHAHMRS